jgi:riboflavin synthase
LFTGIVAAVGRVADLERHAGGVRLAIAAPTLDLGDGRIGESIAVSGACLTAVTIDAAGFSADVSAETLACTTLGLLRAGARVNLERALRVHDRLGGHFVTGHVDGVGRIEAFERDGDGARLTIAVPPALQRYVARKGSIAIDGVSLTVNTIAGQLLTLQLIPHTLRHTILGAYAKDTGVNVEVDLLARHIERLLTAGADAAPVIDEALLRRTGFIT